MTVHQSDMRQPFDAPPRRVATNLRVHERVVAGALIAALNVWIRAIEVLPERRRH